MEIVYCPKCEDQPMLIAAVKPLLFAIGVEEFHYRCQGCGAQECGSSAPRGIGGPRALKGRVNSEEDCDVDFI